MATAIAILLAAAGCGAPAGPLEVPEGTTETGGAWDVGTLMAFGTVTIRNPTDEAMTLLSATLNPQASHTGVTIADVYVFDLTGVTETSALHVGFPPWNQALERFVPAANARLNPATQYQLMFVVRIDRPGNWSFPSVTIAYEALGRRYQVHTNQGLRLCAPRGSECG